jgi:Papain family cysteine protease
VAVIQLKGGCRTRDPRLDRIPQFDERSRRFSVAHRAPELIAQKPMSKRWTVGVWLDQGSEGACTGFSRAHALAATPRPWSGLTEEDAKRLYRRARQLDEWPGEDYEGSSVIAACKAAVEDGKLSRYIWSFTLEEFILGLSYKGPAVTGCNWHEGMYDANDAGYIEPTGDIIGGHAVLIHGQHLVPGGTGPWGIDLDASYIIFWNSWGPTWGEKGTARMTMRNWDALRRADADVSFGTDVRPVKVSP